MFQGQDWALVQLFFLYTFYICGYDTHLQGKYCEVLISTVLLLEKMEYAQSRGPGGVNFNKQHGLEIATWGSRNSNKRHKDGLKRRQRRRKAQRQ